MIKQKNLSSILKYNIKKLKKVNYPNLDWKENFRDTIKAHVTKRKPTDIHD